MQKNLQILDCTLRDGGYYNNWNFSKSFVQKYVNILSKTNIKYIEIGFRSKSKNKNIGYTGYTDDRFLNKINFPKSLSIGVMINSSELFESNNDLRIKEFFPKRNNKIKFVRLATHIKDIFKIGKTIEWLKNKNFLVAVNIMQISEIKHKDIKKYCKFLSSKNLDILYLADSFGSLKPAQFKKIFKKFQKYWLKDMGIHAHDNLNYAFKNTTISNQIGVNWLDGTIKGMGRGPGNAKTEKLLEHYGKKFNLKKINYNLINDFEELKKKYKWGTNKYYKFSGKYKIHPTYVQEIIANKKINKKDISNILKQLSKNDAKKFNPINLYFVNNFLKEKSSPKLSVDKILNNKSFIIIGPGESVRKNKKKINNLITNKNLIIIYVNNTKNIFNSKNYYRIACHPQRLLTDWIFHKKNRTQLIMPASNLSEVIKKNYKPLGKRIIDYGLKILDSNKILIKNSNCVLPRPLVIGYSLAFCLSTKPKEVFLIGFDGYKKDDPFNDDTQMILDIYNNSKYNKKIKLLSSSGYKFIN